MALSPAFNPPVLKGIKVYPDNPLRFDFILDKGDDKFTDDQIKIDSTRLIKYFLASLTIPEKDLWVNLSPYEKDRIVPEAFGQTEMGRDLLAQDYLLKQITASVIYPEGDIGKKFWKKIYALAQEKYGTTDIPVDTFNKVWIVPEKAVVYENGKVGAAYVTESRLKVMLESDYLAQEKNAVAQTGNETNEIAKEVMRAVVIPELEREVNEGKNFAKLRQVYQSLILAAWYKKKIKQSLLSAVYVDRKKIDGVNIPDSKEAEKIWGQYVEAFKKGMYDFVKEEKDDSMGEVVSRKYFSGGLVLDMSQDIVWSNNVPDTLDKAARSSVVINMRLDLINTGYAESRGAERDGLRKTAFGGSVSEDKAQEGLSWEDLTDSGVVEHFRSVNGVDGLLLPEDDIAVDRIIALELNEERTGIHQLEFEYDRSGQIKEMIAEIQDGTTINDFQIVDDKRGVRLAFRDGVPYIWLRRNGWVLQSGYKLVMNRDYGTGGSERYITISHFTSGVRVFEAVDHDEAYFVTKKLVDEGFDPGRLFIENRDLHHDAYKDIDFQRLNEGNWVLWIKDYISKKIKVTWRYPEWYVPGEEVARIKPSYLDDGGTIPANMKRLLSIDFDYFVSSTERPMKRMNVPRSSLVDEITRMVTKDGLDINLLGNPVGVLLNRSDRDGRSPIEYCPLEISGFLLNQLVHAYAVIWGNPVLESRAYDQRFNYSDEPISDSDVVRSFETQDIDEPSFQYPVSWKRKVYKNFELDSTRTGIRNMELSYDYTGQLSAMTIVVDPQAVYKDFQIIREEEDFRLAFRDQVPYVWLKKDRWELQSGYVITVLDQSRKEVSKWTPYVHKFTSGMRVIDLRRGQTVLEEMQEAVDSGLDVSKLHIQHRDLWDPIHVIRTRLQNDIKQFWPNHLKYILSPGVPWVSWRYPHDFMNSSDIAGVFGPFVRSKALFGVLDELGVGGRDMERIISINLQYFFSGYKYYPESGELLARNRLDDMVASDVRNQYFGGDIIGLIIHPFERDDELSPDSGDPIDFELYMCNRLLNSYAKGFGDLVLKVVPVDKAQKVDDMHRQVGYKTRTIVSKGGIDFNFGRIKLVNQENSSSIEFRIDPAQLQQLQNATGFSPVIIGIQPINSLNGFLGLADQPVVGGQTRIVA